MEMSQIGGTPSDQEITFSMCSIAVHKEVIMSSTTKLYGKDLSEYDNIDIDELLQSLTEEQLEQLGQELIDPDDSHIPASERCAYRTDKKPMGPFNRKKLLEFIETKAREEKDWDEVKPYSKQIRGKVWKKKDEKIELTDEHGNVETEWDDVLANATEEELVDLAAILGFHGMLNQVQYHRAFISGEKDGGDDDDESDDDDEDDEGGAKADKKKKTTGFQGVARHQDFKLVPDEPPNNTNPDDALKKLAANDPGLVELNLNNIRTMKTETLVEIAQAIKENKVLKQLQLANTRATDRVAVALGESLKTNETLEVLNIESNYLSGNAIATLLEAINETDTIVEFRVANQLQRVLGVKCETRLARLIKENKNIKKFGIFLEVPDARVKISDYIQRNNDTVRQERIEEKDK